MEKSQKDHRSISQRIDRKVTTMQYSQAEHKVGSMDLFENHADYTIDGAA